MHADEQPYPERYQKIRFKALPPLLLRAQAPHTGPRLVECGAALSEEPPRRRPPGLVIFDSTGVAIQDVKMAELALDVLRSPAGKL